jgi:hypothetical protein
MKKEFIIKDKETFIELIEDKTELYKFIIDNYKHDINIKIPEIYSIIVIEKNKELIEDAFKHFVKCEEYEYADKMKKLNLKK